MEPAAAGHLTCGSVVGPGTVVLDSDLTCLDTNSSPAALTVGYDNTTIKLNGFTISCSSATGYLGSCQGLGNQGVRMVGRERVRVKGPGVISGFDVGVAVHTSSRVRVRGLTIEGPTDAASRPETPVGISVQQSPCPIPPRPHVWIQRNEVSSHLDGIKLGLSGCAHVIRNETHHNSSDVFGPNHGITVEVSDRNRIAGNRSHDNGTGGLHDAGITLDSSNDNVVTGNDATANRGDGILLHSGAQDNVITRNQARKNTSFDLAARNAGPGNVWANSNKCHTQGGTGSQPIPAGVCNPGE
jgi:parallel beta-helix repeat protein